MLRALVEAGTMKDRMEWRGAKSTSGCWYNERQDGVAGC